MHIARPETDGRTVRLVVLDFSQRCPPSRNRIATCDQFAVCDIRCLYGSAASIGFDQTIAPNDDAVTTRTRRNVVSHADQMPGKPIAVAIHTKVLDIRSKIRVNRTFVTQPKARTDRANRDVAHHRAKFITRFGVEGCSLHAICNVVRHVDVARVIHKAPAG